MATVPTKEIHPAASIFPLLEGKDFEALVEDIRAHGLREPIWIHPDGRLLDGRNRLRACELLGITPPYRVYSGNGSPETFVISMNLFRRHLTTDQRAGIMAKWVLPGLEEEAKRKQHASGEHGKEGGRGKKKNPPGKNSGRVLTVLDQVRESAMESAEKAAEIGKTNSKYVRQARDLGKQDPEVLDRIIAGELKLRDAVRKQRIEEIKERAKEEKPPEQGLIEDLAAVAGQYRCILADPPWKYSDEGCEGSAARHYPTMLFAGLRQIETGKLAHADGAHLWMWTTWPMIRDKVPHELLDAWGFRWVGEIVWNKVAMGVGRWLRPQTEVLILAIRGDPGLPLLAADQRGHIEVARGRHSAKPEAIYPIIERLSPGPRIELFARGVREGWSRWGLEA